MLRLIKYLKREIVPILAIVLLLIFQAACDLSLPDYTSDIVNVGIQQGGVPDATPEVIRQQTMDGLTMFMTDNEQNIVNQNYTVMSREHMSDQEYQNDCEKYPALKTEQMLKLNGDLSDQTRSQLNEIFGKAFMSKAVLQKAEAGQITSGAASEQLGALKSQIMAGMSPEQQQQMAQMGVMEIVKTLPAQTQRQLGSEIRSRVDQMQDMIVTQAATSMVKDEYEAIGMDLDSMQMWYLLGAGVRMLLVAFGSLTAAVVVTLLASRVAAALSRELRERMYAKVLAFSGREMDLFSTSSLITRCTNDVQQIQLLMVMLLRIVFYAPIIGIGGVIKVMRTQGDLVDAIALAVGVIFGVMVLMFIFVMPKFNIMQKLVDKLNLVMRETLTGLPVIRAFSTQKHEQKRFDSANMDLTKANIFVNRVMGCMMPVMLFVMNGAAILIVWIGGHGVDSGTMQVGNMMAVIQYAMQIILAFLMISIVSVMLPRASVSAKRIEEVLQTPITIRDPEHPIPFSEEEKGVVRFEHVSFRYPEAQTDVLHDITFTANPGETTAIIGSTGCGKSTLINLIPRFFDITEGKLTVGGASVKRVKLRDLRDMIGYVPQKGVLFSGDIESNISYGKRLPHEWVEQAAKVSQSSEFIEEKPEKYQSAVSQGGTNVSGGQRQRLSIARAIAKKPQIYIFDDSFSALDFKTDRALRQALKEETAHATMIIVAQRISTIMNAQKIIVLDKGCIVGQGTHPQLMQSCPVYREIAQSQMTKEELENV